MPDYERVSSDGSRRAKEDEILDQLGQALSELRALRDQNEQLRKLADLGKKHLGKELERREPDAILHNPQRSVERVPGVRLDSLQAVELRPRKDRDPLSMLTSGANALYSKEHEVSKGHSFQLFRKFGSNKCSKRECLGRPEIAGQFDSRALFLPL